MTTSRIKNALNIPENKISAVLKLLAEGATIPFIARYRKELTGSLDEVQIAEIRDLNDQFLAFDKRRSTILDSLQERHLLTSQLKVAIEACKTLQELEDLYLPHRPKKRTRASIARDKGLENLANELLLQNGARIDFSKYINRHGRRTRRTLWISLWGGRKGFIGPCLGKATEKGMTFYVTKNVLLPLLF